MNTNEYYIWVLINKNISVHELRLYRSFHGCKNIDQPNRTAKWMKQCHFPVECRYVYHVLKQGEKKEKFTVFFSHYDFYGRINFWYVTKLSFFL